MCVAPNLNQALSDPPLGENTPTCDRPDLPQPAVTVLGLDHLHGLARVGDERVQELGHIEAVEVGPEVVVPPSEDVASAEVHLRLSASKPLK